MLTGVPHSSQNNHSELKAGVAIFAVLSLIGLGLLPWAGDGGDRRYLVFWYALVAVLLGLWRMSLTIWMHRDENPAALQDQERKHGDSVLLLDVFTVVFGAPAALMGAASFLG